MVVTTGNTIEEVTRISTGIPPLDLILGGGIPHNRVIEIFGPPDSFKSSLANMMIASHQHIYPELKCVLFAIEPFDPTWAKKFGVDVEKLWVVNPVNSEQVIDISEGLMDADDCGLVVLDSFAALDTQNHPGDLATVGRRLFDKVVTAQRKAEKEGRAPTFIFTNQIRYRKGVAGEITTPGGFTPRHAAAIRLRLSASDIVDKEAPTPLPARKEVRVVVENHKIPVAAQECIFEIAMLNQPGLQVGQVKDNWKILSPAFHE